MYRRDSARPLRSPAFGERHDRVCAACRRSSATSSPRRGSATAGERPHNGVYGVFGSRHVEICRCAARLSCCPSPRSRLQWRIAACGSADKPLAASGVSYDANLKIAWCMRAHRVSNFPDPSASVAGEGRGGFSIQSDVNGSSEQWSTGSASADRRARPPRRPAGCRPGIPRRCLKPRSGDDRQGALHPYPRGPGHSRSEVRRQWRDRVSTRGWRSGGAGLDRARLADRPAMTSVPEDHVVDLLSESGGRGGAAAPVRAAVI
jgi:hypothetical protein